MTRTSQTGMLIFALFMGAISAPQEFVWASNSGPCQAESDALDAANNAFVNAELDYADAVDDLSLAQYALDICESTTPGNCQAELDDVAAAEDLVDLTYDAVGVASGDLSDAYTDYYDCLYGGY